MCDKLNWIVIPGGPGLSKSYLESGFAGSFVNYKLHYYSPLGAPEIKIDHVPTINELVEQIFTFAAKKNFAQFGLITHSFGSYLAMRALMRSKHNIAGIVMVSPMPFFAQHWQNALQKIAARVPTTVLRKIQELARDKKNGAKIFELLFPYYATKSATSLPHTPFDLDMCNKIAAQVGDYDDRDLLTSCNVPWVCIAGENDPFYIEKDLLGEKTILLIGLGHYPFFENPNVFARATRDITRKNNRLMKKQGKSSPPQLFAI